MPDASTLRLPWLAAPLRRTLERHAGHALLVQGPCDVGQFELALALAQGWLCEADAVAVVDRPCGVCASCRLFHARSHPDLLVLLPEALRESLGWTTGEGEEGGDERSGKKKPSKEIRVDEVRVAIAFALTTSARGRGKVVVVHPAERMNAIAANAFLKTLEEPPGDARFVLASAAPDALLPTIRSRCQALSLGVPEAHEASAWLAKEGVADPSTLLAACGGQPLEVLTMVSMGIDAAAWRALPRRVADGDPSGFRAWPLGRVADALQKLCHDVACIVVGAAPRYFPAASLPKSADLSRLVAVSRELRRFAQDAEHPWLADLSIDSLVAQCREALQTPRSPRRELEVDSLHSRA